MKKLLAVLILILGCSSTQEKNGFDIESKRPSEDYSDVVEKWTRHQKGYRGLSSSFQVTATLNSTEVLEGQLYLDGRQYHWTETEYNEKRQKTLLDAQTEISVFITLFTEKDENNNLDKTDGNWNLFLEADGARVKPKSVKRSFDTVLVLKEKYPYVDNWTRRYVAKFPIPAGVTLDRKVALEIAGPIGQSRLVFDAD